MNATARVVTPQVAYTPSLGIVIRLPKLQLIILFVVVLITALSVIYAKDLARRVFIDLQNTQQTAEVLSVQHNKLLLEESTLVNQARIQLLAEQKLNMRTPTARDIVILKTT